MNIYFNRLFVENSNFDWMKILHFIRNAFNVKCWCKYWYLGTLTCILEEVYLLLLEAQWPSLGNSWTNHFPRIWSSGPREGRGKMRALGYRQVTTSKAHSALVCTMNFPDYWLWTQIGKKILLHNVHFKSPPPYFQIDDIEVTCDDEHCDETRHDGCRCVHSRHDRKQHARQ